jgi:hypothetical protein
VILFSFILFEVMDKEWPIWFVLLLFVGLGLCGLLLSRKWPLAGVLMAILVLAGGFRQAMELSDPSVGPAIGNEAGLGYVILSYASITLGIVLPVVGTWLGRAKRNRYAN